MDVTASPRDAARAACDAKAGGVVVIDQGEEAGVVTVHALLAHLAEDTDPLTGLPRADALRDWMWRRLEEGKELSVLFLDLDDFKSVNRDHGHPAGDVELRRFAQALRAGTDEGADFCARYGGDEFVIATMRDRDEAASLAAMLASVLPRPASIGIAGGRRKSPRPDANLGAIVEDLLRLASLDCMSKKSDA